MSQVLLWGGEIASGGALFRAYSDVWIAMGNHIRHGPPMVRAACQKHAEKIAVINSRCSNCGTWPNPNWAD